METDQLFPLALRHKSNLCFAESAHLMEMEDTELSSESQERAEGEEHHLTFWVVRVPEAVFSTDPQDSLRVSKA